MSEDFRVNEISQWYLEKQLDFDKKLIQYRYETIKPFLAGPFGLELGPAEGQMTKLLIHHFERLTVVEGARELLEKVPNHSRLLKVNSLFENYQPSEKYNSIMIEHVLEHVADPVNLLIKASQWLAEDGRIFLGVPNANSFHRLAAVKMGILQHQTELNERDIAVGHRRVYTPDSFRMDIQKSGLRIINFGGIFFKPASNAQIQNTWTNEMISGFYELGKDFPDNCADIYAICSNK